MSEDTACLGFISFARSKFIGLCRLVRTSNECKNNVECRMHNASCIMSEVTACLGFI
jgi:hypothetical protein